MAGSTRGGPTALRIAPGAQLRRLREASSLTTAEAADAIRATHSKVSRLERGRCAARLRDVADPLSLYGVTDQAERGKLLALAREASVPSWSTCWS
jgi:transcriptional regulator with XRE-family HTH domain